MGAPRAKTHAERILVRSPNWIGDQVLAYPFFHYLRRAYPNARITAVCVPWVSELQFRDLIDEVHVLPRFMGKTWMEKYRALESCAAELRALGPWDLAFSLPNSLSSAWMLYRSGARVRRGYGTEGRSLLLNDAVKWDPSPTRHRSKAYIDLLPESARPSRDVLEFWGVPPVNDLDEGIPGELSRFNAEKSWPIRAEENVELPKEPYWVLAPGATADSRRWPEEYFSVLARKIATETGMTGVIVGGPKEAPIAVRLIEDPALKLIDRTAQGPVPGLARLLSGARFTVTNESGLAHVASLCGSFVQIVCGAADPRRTRPLGPGKVQIAVNPVDCWPCERNTCSQPAGLKFQCLKGIQAETVWEEIKRGLGVRNHAP